jgi:hypothetical protein
MEGFLIDLNLIYVFVPDFQRQSGCTEGHHFLFYKVGISSNCLCGML